MKFLKYTLIGTILITPLAIIGMLAYHKKLEIRELSQKKEFGKESFEEQLKAAIQTDLKQEFNLEITYDKAAKHLTIVNTETSPAGGLDSTMVVGSPIEDLFRRGISLFVYGNITAFKTGEIEKVTLIHKIPLSIEGLETPREIIKSTVSKEKFMSVNWDQFIDKRIDGQIKKIADEFAVDPSVLRSFKTVDVFVLLPN